MRPLRGFVQFRVYYNGTPEPSAKNNKTEEKKHKNSSISPTTSVSQNLPLIVSGGREATSEVTEEESGGMTFDVWREGFTLHT